MNFIQRFTTRLVALQHRDFRLLWFGFLVATIGMQMQNLAVTWHIYELLRGTSSSIAVFGRTVNLDAGALALGGLGLVRFLPMAVFGLLGGMLADTRDRRHLLMLTQGMAALFAATLAAITLSGHATVLLIYTLTGAITAIFALESPARESLIPNLVPRSHLTNAMSLTSLMLTVGTIIGPAIAGVIVARMSIGVVYALHAVSFGPALLALLLLHYRGKPRGTTARIEWRALADGFRFTYNQRMIWGTMMLDFFATLLASARTMLPIVADEILGIGVQGYGLLLTAQPVGSVLAGTLVSLRRDIRRQGVTFLVSVVVYASATALFGISTVFVLSYVLFALTGAADTVSSIIRGTIRQMLTPDTMRGRMVGASMVFYMGGPQLGEVRAGLVASALGVPFAIVSGGITTLLVALWVAWRSPHLRHYTSDMAQEIATSPLERTGQEA